MGRIQKHVLAIGVAIALATAMGWPDPGILESRTTTTGSIPSEEEMRDLRRLAMAEATVRTEPEGAALPLEAEMRDLRREAVAHALQQTSVTAPTVEREMRDLRRLAMAEATIRAEPRGSELSLQDEMHDLRRELVARNLADGADIAVARNAP